MNNPIKFGTDGWRAVIAREFTFDNVRICAQAVADYLKRNNLAEKGLVVGYDTRFASEDFAAASAEVLAGNSIKVFLCPTAAPTPVVSYGVAHKQAGGAIIITASHNPSEYNGFKVKSPDGASAPAEAISEIEKGIDLLYPGGKINRIELSEARNKGLLEVYDIAPDYYHKIESLIDLDRIRHSGLKIVVDSMYGAGSGYLKKLLSGGKIKVEQINAERNPSFPGIHPEPIAANLNKLSAAVRRRKAAIGIATDGDADRLGIVDENGVFLTQLQVFALLAYYMLDVRKERGAIVKTITTTSMLDKIGKMFGVPVYETKVGFKYVAPIMMKENALIGGEESGGYGFRGHVPERDGILAALYFIDYVVKTGKTPSQLLAELYSKVGPHYYNRIDIDFPESQRQAIIKYVKEYRPDNIDGVKILRIDTEDGFRFVLVDTTWLLIRFSGTEPLLRIYAESNNMERVNKMLEIGRRITGV